MKIRIGIPLIQPELNGRSGWIAGFHFIKNCLSALAVQNKYQVPDIFVFVPTTFDKNLLLINNVQPQWLTIVEIAEEQLSDFNQHPQIEKIIDDYQCDLFFPILSIPKILLKGRTIGWIADFQDRHLPHFFSDDEIQYREMAADFITTYCDHMLCTSRAVYSDLKQFYPGSSAKSSVIHFRSTIPKESLRTDPTVVLTELGINQKYIYLPNQFWVHKNHKTVFEAWAQLQKQGHNYLLVCTGSPDDYRFPDHYQQLLAYLQEHQLSENIKLLGLVDREKQIQLYRGACAILQPSLFEGWNTSLEEANALGKPIIASNIAVHKEQCGNRAVYFNPLDADELASAICSIWKNGTLNNAIEEDAYKTYQQLVATFGEQLIDLFVMTSKLTDQPKYPLLRLPIFLSRRLTAREQDCEARLKLMNELETALNNVTLDKSSFFFKIFQMIRDPKILMDKLKRIRRIYIERVSKN